MEAVKATSVSVYKVKKMGRVEVLVVVGADGYVNALLVNKKIYDLRHRIPLTKLSKICEIKSGEDVVVRAECDEIVTELLEVIEHV